LQVTVGEFIRQEGFCLVNRRTWNRDRHTLYYFLAVCSRVQLSVSCFSLRVVPVALVSEFLFFHNFEKQDMHEDWCTVLFWYW
jgi:hypothetical protein